VVDALILAGAPNTKKLAAVSPESYEALIPLAGRPMVDFVVTALNESPSVGKVVIVGPSGLDYLQGNNKVTAIVPCGDTLMANLRRGLDTLGTSGLVLVATADIPLLTALAVEDFLAQANKYPADFYYSIVEKSVGDAKYPEVKRTYVRLKEGTFTGGNLLLLNPRILDRGWKWAEDMFRLRKEPLKMCRLLGWGFFVRLLLGQLTITAVEQRFEQLFEAKGKAVISPYPEVGIDVDKPADYELAAKYIGQCNNIAM
jgi:GTP:adenosylcobinamide-phosphate guanylyltransferase